MILFTLHSWAKCEGHIVKTSTRRGIFLNIDCLKCLEVERGDLHVSSKQPPGLGRTQGWGLWADTHNQQQQKQNYLKEHTHTHTLASKKWN